MQRVYWGESNTMKNIAALFVLTFGLSALTGWSQPAPGGREDKSSTEAPPSQRLRRPDNNPPRADVQDDRRAPRGQRGYQRDWSPGGNRNFGPNSGPRRRGYDRPPMVNQRRPMPRPDFSPPGGGFRGFAPGARQPRFGSRPMMDSPRQRPGGPGGPQFRPPMGRGQGYPFMRPGRMGRGFGGPPMMNQSPQGRRGQFGPPADVRPGESDRDQRVGSARRGFRGPPMMNPGAPLPQRDIAPGGRGPGRPGQDSLRQSQRRSDGDSERQGPPRQRDDQPRRAPQAPPVRDQN